MTRLAGKVAFITGGGGGIGRATAERFAEEGAKVVVAEIDATVGEAAARSARASAANSGGDSHFVRCDVTERASVEAAIAETIARYGKLDILHNNAGGSTLQDGPVTEAPDEEFWRVIRLDLYGTFLCCKIAIPEIIKAGGGSVINMSSNVALMALPGRDVHGRRGRHRFADPVHGRRIRATQDPCECHRPVGDPHRPGQAAIAANPSHKAFPKWQEGRHPHCHFRGLLRLHTRYGPPDRSAAQGDLCHEAPALRLPG